MAVKDMPTRVYKRGDQGTFVYAPDITVYVQTDEYGTVDLSPYITNFTLQRNVNQPSTFMCSFDNKFARFDRVIRRMNRIVVFLKRVQWLQVFGGYISVAPWETVVPGDAILMADCTLKRLQYSYWDSHSSEAQALFPGLDSSINTSADGGAGATMFKLLTGIAQWDKDQIQIQKIPDKWLTQAVKILKQAQDEDIANVDTTVVREALVKLLDADGWLSGDIGKAYSVFNTSNNSTGGMRETNGVDAEWRKLVGKKDVRQYPAFGSKLDYYSGFAESRLANSHQFDSQNRPIMLRPDAAASVHALMDQPFLTFVNPPVITEAYHSYAQQKAAIAAQMKANHNKSNLACENVSCPAGASDHGWGTAIDFDPGRNPAEEIMNNFGWMRDTTVENENHWVFVGHYPEYPAFVTRSDVPTTLQEVREAGKSPDGQFDWTKYEGDQVNADQGQGSSVFKWAYYTGPGLDPIGLALTGKRAWMNDVPVLESVAQMASASRRDFQSAPNGDFVAFFPDRLGIYGKFPTMEVRDIEVANFKLTISDHTLVTHFVSVGDVIKPLEPLTGVDTDLLMTSGYVSVEQPEVMKLLLGLDEIPVGLGDWFLGRFGLRPRREDNYDIQNYGYNWMIALHRFEEAWASQWQAMVEFTFMPELYPGMRIELVDHGLGVYVESVTHVGSRTGGFNTQVIVSSPMRKKDNKWVLLRMEFDPTQFAGTDKLPDDVGETTSVIHPEGYFTA